MNGKKKKKKKTKKKEKEKEKMKKKKKMFLSNSWKKRRRKRDFYFTNRKEKASLEPIRNSRPESLGFAGPEGSGRGKTLKSVKER